MNFILKDKNLENQEKKVSNSLTFKLVCLFYSLFQSQKRLFSFKGITLVIIILLFTFFSFSKLNNINSNNLLAEITNKEESVIKSGFPEIKDLEEDSDFKIAAFREQAPDKIDHDISLALGNSILIPPQTKITSQDIVQPTRTEIETYIVQSGDTISTIAEKFGLSWNTILWENNLNYWSVIKPGKELRILPVNGITHKIKSGENLSSLSKKYQSSVEKIADLNNLSPDSILQPGEKIIIPDGTPPPAPKPVYVAPTPTPQIVKDCSSTYWEWRANTSCHRFVVNQCTDWVAFKWATEQGKCVPSWSHAKYWFGRAQRDGYETGNVPRQGAIMSLTCTSWICSYYGHVAYVESFDANTVTISELNGLRKEAYSTRTLKNITGQWQGGWKIQGYIYP